MYLPLELNTPALVGGILAHFVGKRSAPVRERGVIIASGFMAGGALGGVIGAACRLLPGYEESWIKTALLRERRRLADRLRGRVHRILPVSVVRFREERRGGRETMSERFEELAGNAILGIDTLWGGDVNVPLRVPGRFIADSWFSDAPLPVAYTHPTAAKVRESSGVCGPSSGPGGHRSLSRRCRRPRSYRPA